MKRNLRLFTLLSAILIIALVLPSCTASFSHPINDIKTKMQTQGNYIMTIEMRSGYTYGVKTIKSDGKIKYVENYIRSNYSYTTEEYFHMSTNTRYYQASNGSWKSTWFDPTEHSNSIGVSSNDIAFSAELLKALFDSNNYIKVQGTSNIYVQNPLTVFYAVENVEFTFYDSDYGNTECKITMDMSSVQITITVSDIGKVNLTLPIVN